MQLHRFINCKISPPYLHDTFVDVTDLSGRNVHRLFVPRDKINYHGK